MSHPILILIVFTAGCLVQRVSSEGRGPIQWLLWASGSEDMQIRHIHAPTQNVVISRFDGARDLGPEILNLDVLAFPGCGLVAKRGRVNQQVEHPFEVCLVATTKGEPGALDNF